MLSKSAEYGLRIMAYLAVSSPEVPLRAKDIAEQVNIPAFYLSKILRRMVEAGLLKASKGHRGGFTIMRPPSKITFLEVLLAIDGDISQPMCVFGWDRCSDKTPCALHQRWKSLRAAFLEWAHTTTLEDVRGDLIEQNYLQFFRQPVNAGKTQLRKIVRTGPKKQR